MEYEALLALLLSIVYRSSVLKKDIDEQKVTEMLSGIVVQNGLGNNPQQHRITGIKELVEEILSDEGSVAYDIQHLITRINSILVSSPDWADTITDGLMDDTVEQTASRLSKDIHTMYHLSKIDKVNKVIKDASYKLNNGGVSFSGLLEYTKDTILELEEVVTEFSDTDEAIVSHATTSDIDTMIDVYDSADELISGDMVYKLPYKYLNIGLQGGIRLTDTAVISALQHNYKSGITMQIGVNIPRVNKAVLRDKGKPCLVRISFEDSLENNFLFMYNEMYHNKHKEAPSKDNIPDSRTRAKLVTTELTKNGWEVEFVRVNPSNWSYRDIQDYVTKLETDKGYDVQILVLDYLMLVPTAGCITTGPMGTDLRDLLRRMRNWGAAKSTAIITPLQLNTVAKRKLAENTAPKDFLQSIKGCGMYSGSGQLDQEFDIGILIHVVNHNDKCWLNVVVEKHRTPETIDSSRKAFFIPFTSKSMPLLADVITGENLSVRRLPTIMDIDDY